MRIIGLTGKAGSGKDTVAKIVTDELESKGQSVCKLSFAAPLKDCAALLWGWDRDRLEGDFDYKEGDTLDDGSPDPACKALGMTRRVFMQLFGTEAMRNNIHKDVWVTALKMSIARGDYDNYDVGMLTDCRFINELKFVADLDGQLFKVVRGGSVTTLTTSTEHASELEWDTWTNWDGIIHNNIDDSLSMEENLSALRGVVIDNIMNPIILAPGINYAQNVS